MKYTIVIDANLSSETIKIECSEISFKAEARLQSETIGHILSNPIKLITTEIKSEIKALQELE